MISKLFKIIISIFKKNHNNDELWFSRYKSKFSSMNKIKQSAKKNCVYDVFIKQKKIRQIEEAMKK